VANTIGNERIAVGPLQELDLRQLKADAPAFLQALSIPPASKVVTVSCSSLCGNQSTHSLDWSGRVRPSVQFVNRFDGEYVRRLQRARNPNFPSEECLHAGNIG